MKNIESFNEKVIISVNDGYNYSIILYDEDENATIAYSNITKSFELDANQKFMLNLSKTNDTTTITNIDEFKYNIMINTSILNSINGNTSNISENAKQIARLLNRTDKLGYKEKDDLDWVLGIRVNTNGNKQNNSNYISTSSLQIFDWDENTYINLLNTTDGVSGIAFYSSNVASASTLVKFIGFNVGKNYIEEEYWEYYFAITFAFNTTVYSDLEASEIAKEYILISKDPDVEQLDSRSIPYKKIMPDHLYGFTTGRNKCPINVSYETTFQATSAIILNRRTDYFHLEPNTLYCNLSSNSNGSSYIGLKFYDKNFKLIQIQSNVAPRTSLTSIHGKFTTPENTEWCICYFYEGCNVQICEGDVFYTDYRPYEVIPPSVTNWDEVKISNEFLAETEKVVSEVLDGNMGKLRFIHITDTHMGSGGVGKEYNMLYQTIIDISKRLACDFIVHTGDVITGSSTGINSIHETSLSKMKDIFYDCDIPVIITRGNHDDNSSGDRSEDKIISNTWWNNNMCYSFNKASSKFTFPQNSNGYYYYNIIDKKIRVVNINSEDLTDDERITIGGQNYAVISQNQLDWLNEDALIVEDDWKIIIVSHISCDTGRPNMSISNSDLLMEVIKNNKDNIILYIYGHTHISVNYMNKDLGIQFISTNTSGGSHVTYTEPGHNWGYVSSSLISSCDTGAMLFDICILNYDNTISRYRWGVKDDVLESDNMNSYLN